MKYKILVWMLIDGDEQDDPLTYDSWNDAVQDKQNLELMQPENIYRIVAVEEVDDVQSET